MSFYQKHKSAFALAFLIVLALSLPACKKPPEATAPVTGPYGKQVLVDDGMGGQIWVREIEELPVSNFEESDFAANGEFVTYTGGDFSVRQGVDVSFYQGRIDWRAVKSAGIDFAIIRAGYRGYTEGALYEDERFEENLSGAKAAGLDVGVYFFSQALNEAEAKEEAAFVLNLLRNRYLDLPVFFDWEQIEDQKNGVRTDNMAGTELTDCALAFGNAISAEGYEPGLYFYRKLGYFLYELERLRGLTFWAAAPGDFPDFYYAHSSWQYSYTARVDGFGGYVDLDLQFT
ncbi:MAG: hypothetical protein LBR98_05740 [Syntrophomonadaceae bacterium]|jgi:GH25 family lysozyme M1 (1,4-beta-N-acetylmuramidase)|nr:hypothetical protein [Syntrophomonadaceae bacterium]